VISNRPPSEIHVANPSVATTLPEATMIVQDYESIQTLPPELPPPPKRQRPIKLILTGLASGAIVAVGLGYRYWQYASTHQTTDNAVVVGHIHQVSSKISGTVTNVAVDDNDAVKAGALLIQLDPRDNDNQVQQTKAALESAKRQADAAQATVGLASQTTNGKTAQATGDVSVAAAAIKTAESAVGEAQAGIASAQAAVAEAQAGVPVAEAQVSQADASLQKAQADYDRYNTLYQQGAISRQQLDTAKAADGVAQAQKSAAVQGVTQAEARLGAAKFGVAKATSQLAQAQEGVISAQAKLAASTGSLQQAAASGQQTAVNRSQYSAARSAVGQADAALKASELQRSYVNIIAPSAGRVGKKNVEVGTYIQVGSPLMAVIDNDYWIVANFKETQLAKIQPGQPVEVKLDAFPGHIFNGRVDSISPASGAQFSLLPPDNATGNFTKIVQRIPVKIVFDRQSMQAYATRITPGMSAEVAVTTR
jgi:membrane fusion protein, multidrug efflux system